MDAATATSVRQLLGKPMVPSSIQVLTDDEKHHVTLHVPVYTDIESDGYLAQAQSFIQEQARDARDSVQALYRCIDRLDPLNRALLLLYLDERSHCEIADILGMKRIRE